MKPHNIVTKDEWIKKRKELLGKEKQLTKLKDELTLERKNLPWYQMKEDYLFEDEHGKVKFRDLFNNCRQLIMYHLRYHFSWKYPSKECAFFAEHFNGLSNHLRSRDTSFVAVSNVDINKITAFSRRMSWNFKWVSSLGSDFNYDLNLSRSEKMGFEPMSYNFDNNLCYGDEVFGISIYFMDEKSNIFCTYATFARGVEVVNTTYNLLDLTPLGRDEEQLAYPLAWLNFKDLYSFCKKNVK